MGKYNSHPSHKKIMDTKMCYSKSYVKILFTLLLFYTSVLSSQCFSGNVTAPIGGGTQTRSLTILNSSQCEEPYILDSMPSWVTLARIDGFGTSLSITFRTNSNTSSTTRSGNIVFGSEFGTTLGTVFIRQNGAPQAPPTPTGTITIVENNCGEATLRAPLYAPSSTTREYWQTTRLGTSTDFPSRDYEVTSSGTYYLRRRTVPNGLWSASSLASPPVSVVQFNPGTIVYSGSSNVLCSGDNPPIINSVSAASGGDSYSYQWQSATSQNGSYSNISGATGVTYDPPALTGPRWYRRSVTSCSGQIKLSNVVSITISPPVGTPTGNGNNRCGSGSVVLTASPGANANTIRWYAAATGGSILATGTTFTTPSISSTRNYYAESYNTSTQCNSATRVAVEAEILIPQTWYLDADSDGFYPTGGTQSTCSSPGSGWTTTIKTPGDCDDTDPLIITTETWYLDADNDGFYPTGGMQENCGSPGTGWTTDVKIAGDCDDVDPDITLPLTWFLDADNDDFYPTGGMQTSCVSPGLGWSTTTKTSGDCDDDNPDLNPNTIWYADEDQDGFADLGGQTIQQCEMPDGNWITNSDFPPCTDFLSGNGNTPSGITAGSFEGAADVVIENTRNETLGSSGWTATSGTPDTFLPPYSNSTDIYVGETFEASPNAGVVAGALRFMKSAEAFQTQVDGLTAGMTYVVEFYQANATRIISPILTDQTSGFWKVSFDSQIDSSQTMVPGGNNVPWTRNRLEFTANQTNVNLGFEVGSTAIDSNNALPVYMLLDGVRVYIKPSDQDPSYVCSDILIETFCSADPIEPKISDLTSPFPQTLGWFSQADGGQRFFENDLLSELPVDILWADDGSDADRIAVEIIFNEGMPDGNRQQFFDVVTTPRIENLSPNGPNIKWFDSFTSTTELTDSTPLTDNTTYYASQDGATCRLAVDVTVSAPQPEGDGYQEFCSTSNVTIADIVVTKTDPNYNLLYYSEKTGGVPLATNVALVDGATYYVAQDNGSEVTVDRLPIRIGIIDVEALARVYQRDARFGVGSTIADLSSFLDFDASVLWYDSQTGGTAYGPTFALGNETYYARVGQGLCAALEVFEVAVTIGDVVDPELVKCVKFLPQPGDRYVISGWVREEPLLVDQTENRLFVDQEEAKQAFVRLLNHIESKVVNDMADGDLPPIYVLNDDPDGENIDVRALVPYIKNSVSKNVTVYDFRFETELVGGHERAVGFSFALVPGSNADRFLYMTPPVTITIPIFEALGLEGQRLKYRYPIRNNNFTTEFEDVDIVNNKFVISSTFQVPNDHNPFAPPSIFGSGDLNLRNSTPSNDDSGIDESVEFITYKEDPTNQSIAYENTRIELSYTDENGDPLVSDSSVIFAPKGPVIDGWQRISGDFEVPGIGNSGGAAATMTITLKTENPDTGNINAYFDDVRMHPFDSNMKTFVYDPVTQRLMSELDENNFATFYEYDIEGGLVRVKKETERGIYTIQETRSGNSKLNRSTLFEN